MLESLSAARLARSGLLLFAAGIVTLHLLPAPMLSTTTGQMLPYDPRLNFLSEYVRTQYGLVMTASFWTLGATAAAAAWAFRRAGLGREALALAVAALFAALLALFPTDLTDLRADGPACDLALRIEPCTWVGRVHNPLSSVVFGCLGATWLSLALRRRPEWKAVVRGGVACLVLAAVLVGASALYLMQLRGVGRHWLGLMQRSAAASALLWFWLVLRRLEGLPTRRALIPDA